MTDMNKIVSDAMVVADKAAELSGTAANIAEDLMNVERGTVVVKEVMVSGVDPFIFAITVFVLACFVGYYVVWKVTPALHTPLMSVTNAISSIIIVGAILASVTALGSVSNTLGLAAIFIASVNIFGGFIVTQRMLHMFKKK